MRLILASSSPRRRELLETAGFLFEVIPSPAEELHDATMPPHDLCEWNATLKAADVARLHPRCTVIGADTLVFLNDQPLGKPKDLLEAREMLRSLSGCIHQVCTGVCIIRADGSRNVFHEFTEVSFQPLNESQIDNYFALVDPLDKAGAYGIQEHGEMIIARIDGNFSNVMGLPIEQVIAALSWNRVAESRAIGEESPHGDATPVSDHF